MSEKAFQEARQGLAFSQQMREKLMGQNSPQPQGGMDEAPMEQGMESPTPEQEPQQDIAEIVKSTMEPYLEEIKALIENKKPQEVEVKIEGEMKPKDETTP